MTNLPQAAGVLASRFMHQPETREALLQMGDLAGPPLAGLARAGSIEAMDSLQEIGTPQAALALVPLLWHPDRSVASAAALRLASLLPAPQVEDVLRQYEFSEEQQEA